MEKLVMRRRLSLPDDFRNNRVRLTAAVVTAMAKHGLQRQRFPES